MSSLPVLIVRLFIPPDLPAWRKVDVHAKVGLQFRFEDGTKAQVSQGEGHVFLHLPEKNEKNQSKEKEATLEQQKVSSRNQMRTRPFVSHSEPPGDWCRVSPAIFIFHQCDKNR